MHNLSLEALLPAMPAYIEEKHLYEAVRVKGVAMQLNWQLTYTFIRLFPV